jgi:hypothetical protein
MSTGSRPRETVSGMKLPSLSGKGPSPVKNRISFVDIMRSSNQENPKFPGRLSYLNEESPEDFSRISSARKSSLGT